MANIRKSDWPSLVNGSWLSNFFDNDRFYDSDLLKRTSTPAVNVRETDDGFEIDVAAPGLAKKDFSISVDNHVLTISSEKQDESETRENNGYMRREFSYSSFSRSFALPENVNEEDVRATYADGVLKIALSKVRDQQHKSRKAIEVK